MINVIKEYNCETGETIEREMTAAENKQFTNDQIFMTQKLATQKAEAEAKTAARASALAKLAALGLSADELAAL